MCKPAKVTASVSQVQSSTTAEPQITYLAEGVKLRPPSPCLTLASEEGLVI